MALEICEDCQRVFDAGPKEFICKACRRKRLSRYAKERGLSRLGNEAYSKIAAERRRKEGSHE